MSIAAQPYPATFDVDTPERVANWRPLVHWLLAIPHFIILWLFGYVSSAVAIVSWFIVLFTGKLPDGLARLQCLYVRYENRVSSYAGWLVEEYPPFSFEMQAADPGDYGRVQVNFEPALEDRNRLTTAFRWLLALPHWVALLFVGIAAAIAWIIAFFAVLFTGRWPEGLRKFVVGYLRWGVRVSAYSLLLTDEYPPFSLEP